MFDRLAPPEADPIFRLMGQFGADPRDGKIDLGVGVYRDAAGRTPVMGAVIAAEERILAQQQTKGYISFAGDARFLAAMRALLLGEVVDSARCAAVATPGGSGAIRQLLDLVRMAAPKATVWVSRPSWPNHAAIAEAVGLAVREYAYLDPATGAVDRAGMMADLGGAAPGDVVILHGCCHNPCGADLSAADWAAVAELAEQCGFLPFVDVAYQGFGAGVEADAAGLRLLVARLPELLVAASGSKSFGLYRERVGLAMAICADAGAAGRAGAALTALNRTNFSFPPDHGARVVTTILEDRVLRADWEAELDILRARVVANRAALAAALAETTGTDRFGFLTGHRGMFSLLGLAPDEVARLRSDHAVYLVGDGRINLAGLTPATIPAVAQAVAAVLRG